MTSLKKPAEIERWVDFIEGRLSNEEIGEMFGELSSVVQLGGLPGYQSTRLESALDYKVFRKYLKTYHTAREIELFDAALVIVEMNRPGWNAVSDDDTPLPK